MLIDVCNRLHTLERHSEPHTVHSNSQSKVSTQSSRLHERLAQQYISPLLWELRELCHGKSCLKIFVIVILKEWLVDRAPHILLLVWHRLFPSLAEYYFKVGVIPKEGLVETRLPILLRVYPKKDWQRPACQYFFWYDNNKDLKAWFPMTRLTLQEIVTLLSSCFLWCYVMFIYQWRSQDLIQSFCQLSLLVLFWWQCSDSDSQWCNVANTKTTQLLSIREFRTYCSELLGGCEN